MNPSPEVRVHAHPRGDWLVIVGGRRLAVPPRLGRRLLAIDGGRPTVEELGERLGCGTAARALLEPARRRRRGPWWTLPLLPATWVNRGARFLGPVVSARGLLLLAATGAAGSVLGRDAIGTNGDPAVWAVGVVVFMLTGLLHELGHAAALQRAGYPPGGIGLGMVFVLPVLWCDVSAVALLPRRERLLVDLAGPALQLAAAGALALLGRLSPSPTGAVAGTASAVALAAVAWSLLPFVRADGFWLLGDLTGLGDLDREPRPEESTRTVLILAAYRLLHSGFLLMVGGGLAWRLAGAGGTPLTLAGGLLAVATLAFVSRRLFGLRKYFHKPDFHKSGAPTPSSR